MLYRKMPAPIHSILLAGLALLSLTFAPVASASGNPYSLEVSKSSQELIVKEGDQVIKRFRIAIGRGGDGTKRQRGDNKTPSGNYKILDFKANSRFHFFMLINYPNQVDAWHGYIDNRINAREFKQIIVANRNNQVPPQDTVLGGYIGLHGIGEVTEQKLSIHNKENWTEGCIALTNEEISELRNYVTIGTTIQIRE
jgi:murein L,D-transpeptidase YafK